MISLTVAKELNEAPERNLRYMIPGDMWNGARGHEEIIGMRAALTIL